MAEKNIGELPELTELDDLDQLVARSVGDVVTGRISIATLRAAMGGGSGDWSTHPATQDVDLDGHKITGLPAPSAASDAATKGYVDARPGAGAWSEHAATQDVDLDGHKLTGLGEPTDAADAATKGYVDSASPTKIERSFSWGRSVAEITDEGDIELAVYLTGETSPLRRVRVERGNVGGAITLMNRLHSSFVATLRVNASATPSLTYAVTGGPEGVAFHRGGLSFNNGRWYFAEQNGSGIPLGSPDYYALPAGVSSIKHGIHLAKDAYDTLAAMPAPPELEWWEPVWTPVSSNIDSVSNVECSYTRTYRAAGGSLVTLEGTIEVTPNAAGQCAVQVDLPIARVGSDVIAGVASFIDGDDSGIATVSILDLGAGQQLTVQYTPDTDAVHRVSFRLSYRAA